MTRRRLPTGLQTLRKIREEGRYYVDKTPCLRRLVDEAKHSCAGPPPGGHRTGPETTARVY